MAVDTRLRGCCAAATGCSHLEVSAIGVGHAEQAEAQLVRPAASGSTIETPPGRREALCSVRSVSQVDRIATLSPMSFRWPARTFSLIDPTGRFCGVYRIMGQHYDCLCRGTFLAPAPNTLAFSAHQDDGVDVRAFFAAWLMPTCLRIEPMECRVTLATTVISIFIGGTKTGCVD
ncbi:hypothetical protein FQR65_LT20928 [Abscondita terminalis]|nr:hypothetical protein FQR65_LT20928 [Abscondita terminalis]